MPLLVLGSKNYSSWSLRPWLFLRKVGFEFTERVIAFDADDYRQQIEEVSPSGRVPVLILGDNKIWDSLAICEFAADVTGRGLPNNKLSRAVARSAAAEMHSGFQELRDQCPMNIRARDRSVPRKADLAADIDRIDGLWSACRTEYGSGGGWLFGDFSIADAMFAPVLFRFQTYGADLGPESRSYLEFALADPDVRDWQQAALVETHVLHTVDAIGKK
jgi:glutathione S-transferase